MFALKRMYTQTFGVYRQNGDGYIADSFCQSDVIGRYVVRFDVEYVDDRGFDTVIV